MWGGATDVITGPSFPFTPSVRYPDPRVEVLDERFARGEIDADEYRRRRDLLDEAAERRGVRS